MSAVGLCDMVTIGPDGHGPYVVIDEVGPLSMDRQTGERWRSVIIQLSPRRDFSCTIAADALSVVRRRPIARLLFKLCKRLGWEGACAWLIK